MNPLYKKQILAGLIIGLLAVFLFSLFLFMLKNPDLFAKDFFNFKQHHEIDALLLSFSLLWNLALFWIFLKLDKEAISRGVLLATMLVGILIVVLKTAY